MDEPFDILAAYREVFAEIAVPMLMRAWDDALVAELVRKPALLLRMVELVRAGCVEAEHGR